MKRHIYIIILLVSILAIVSCDTVESNSTSNVGGEWLIPSNEIFDGGPGKDGIPSIDSPNFLPPGSIEFLNNDDLVIVFAHGDNIRIYPHPILDWHEIINDKVENTAFAITYCPLTGSAICWDRIIDNEETTFGVSGLLYNSNLIPYDRKTGSNWSQMLIKSVNGALISNQVNTYPIIETSWETAKSSFPNAKVVSTNTGYSRTYGRFPYGSYKTDHDLFIFPVNNTDNRLSSKTRVLGVFGGTAEKAYSISEFVGGKVINDNFSNETFIIYGDTERNIITAFKIPIGSMGLEFKKSTLELPYILEDNLGNHYNLFGSSQDNLKEDLIMAKSFIAYWFAWAAFYPETELFSN